MLKTIENIAGKGTPLCESLQKLYTLCEGVTQSTQQSFTFLNQRYGDGNRPDPNKIAEAVDILVDNDKELYDTMYNTRLTSRAVAWATWMKVVNAFLEYHEAKPLSSEQVKRWFLDGGMSLEEGMKGAVAKIDSKRAERKAELAANQGV